MRTCPVQKPKDNTPRAVGIAYVYNTTQLGICNDRLQGIADFYKAQGEVYDHAGK